MARTTIRTEDITASEVTTAKMAVDPTNASNLSSGSVPLAQLGNVDTTGLEDDIAILGFKVASNGSLAKYDLVDQTIDGFEDASGIDASASTGEVRSSSNYYSGGVAGNYFGDGSDGSLTTSGNVTHTVQNKVGSYDGDMVIKQYSALTISAGHTMTVDQPCRGMFIYVTGNCTINGTLSMTAKGGASDPTATGGSDSSAVNTDGLQLPMLTSGGSQTLAAATFDGAGSGVKTAVANQAAISSSGTIFKIGKTGSAGGASIVSNSAGTGSCIGGTGGSYGQISGNVGTAGTTGGATLTTGGGGSGSFMVMSSGEGAGGNGTSGAGGTGGAFSGGSGGGGCNKSYGTGTVAAGNGANYGGAGGAAYSASGGGGGGAGNPGGALGSTYGVAGSDGVGGIIWLVVGGDLTIGGSGTIQANGASGGGITQNPGGNFPQASAGGGSAGGAVFALYNGTLSNSGSITATGGSKGTAAWTCATNYGGDGGAGGTHTAEVSQAASYNNMTLISTSTTAKATPTKGDIVLTYTNGSGTATINTDIKAYVSRDNGSNYTQMTLASEGTTGGHSIVTAHDVDIGSQPSGTSMRYKIETLNQSAAKETRIQAVSLGWS